MMCPECKNQVISKGFEIFCPKCSLIIEDEPIINKESRIYQEIFSDLTYPDRIFEGNKRDVELICSFFKVPSFVEKEALNIFRACLQKKLSAGRDMENLAFVSFYLATQVQKFEFNLEKLREFDKDVDVAYLRFLAKKTSEVLGTTVAFKDEMIETFSKKLKIPRNVLLKAKDLLKNKELFRNKSEKTRVASVLYFLSKKRPLIEFCRAGNVSPEVVKNLVEVLENG
ncbi:hypothetical protein HZA97_07255 [Candidatus Woesearchaeota archaeon]|nr:hypothetical protein [Candidatus Woesearchaeota archaeon]